MLKRNCVVKFVNNFGVEHAAKVEAESPFEAAVRGLHRTHIVMIAKLKRWIKSHGRHPREEAKKAELRKLLLGTKD
jgi:hypothetical protein